MCPLKHGRQVYVLFFWSWFTLTQSVLDYALLSRVQLCRNYALLGGALWPKFGGWGTQTFLRTGTWTFKRSSFSIWFCCRFIQEVGKALGLRHDTMATAAVYFHRSFSGKVFYTNLMLNPCRFYMEHSFQEFPRYVSHWNRNIIWYPSLLFWQLHVLGDCHLCSISSWQSGRNSKEVQVSFTSYYLSPIWQT